MRDICISVNTVLQVGRFSHYKRGSGFRIFQQTVSFSGKKVWYLGLRGRFQLRTQPVNSWKGYTCVMFFRKVFFFLFFGAGIAVGKVSGYFKFLVFFEKQFEFIININ